MRRTAAAALVITLWMAAGAAAQTPPPSRPAAPQLAGPAPTVEVLNQLTVPPIRETTGTLFENVVKVLSERYVDRKFREEQLPAIVERYRERARESVMLQDLRQVVHDLLSHIPASHLGLLSKATHR